MKYRILMIVAVLAVALVGWVSSEDDQTVTTNSVQHFDALVSVDDAAPTYLPWTNDALKKGTGYWLINLAKGAVAADTAKLVTVIVQQSAQTEPLRGVTQRWYNTDTITVLSGKFGETPSTWNGSYTHTMSGREVRLALVASDSVRVTGTVDFVYRPD
jgi:hypothetical protein